MSEKHAPGPWSVKMGKSTWDPERPDYPVAVVDANGDSVRFSCVTISSGPVCDANTRLIAKAPAMKALLERMRGHLYAQLTAEIDAVLAESQTNVSTEKP